MKWHDQEEERASIAHRKKLTCHGTKIGGPPMETVRGEARSFLQRNPKAVTVSIAQLLGTRKDFMPSWIF